MTGKQQTDPGDLRMKEHDFDRIMRKALQVKPEESKKAKKPKPRKKKAAR